MPSIEPAGTSNLDRALAQAARREQAIKDGMNPNQPLTMNGKIMGQSIDETLKKLKDANEIPIHKTEKALENLDKKAQELSTFQGKVQSLATSLTALQGKIIGSSTAGAFAHREVSLVSGNSSLINAYVTDDAPLGDIKVLVKQLASKDSVNASVGVADLSAPLGWTGSFDVGTLGNMATIHMNASMSMNDVIDAVNNNSAANHLQGTTTTFPGSFTLSLQSLHYAEPVSIDTSNLVIPMGADINMLPVSSTQTVDTLSAKIQLRGIPVDIVYPANIIPAGAQIPGVSFTLQEASPLEPVVIRVQNSQSSAVSAIETFVDSYNALQDYLGEENAYSGTAKNSVGVTNTTLSGNAQGIRGVDLKSLRDVGIQMGGDGKLTYDTTTLINALNSNFSQVSNVFGYNASSTNSSFLMLSRPTTLNQDMLGAGVQITLNKAADNSLSATMDLGSVSYNATLLPPDGNTVVMIGPEGSPLAGLKMLFVGLTGMPDGMDSSKTNTLTMSSGLADQLLSKLTPLLDSDPSKGLFAAERQALEGDPTDPNTLGQKQILEKKLEAQKERAEKKQALFVQRFTKAQEVSVKLEMLLENIKTMVKYQAASAA